jgi:hypothetical protein
VASVLIDQGSAVRAKHSHSPERECRAASEMAPQEGDDAAIGGQGNQKSPLERFPVRVPIVNSCNEKIRCRRPSARCTVLRNW